MRTIHHHHPVAPERLILKKIPKILLGGIFIPLFMSIFSRLLSIIEPIEGTAAEIASHQISIDSAEENLIKIVICPYSFISNRATRDKNKLHGNNKSR